MILVELLMWFSHVHEGGTFVFHDTCWPTEMHEQIAGQVWERPETAVVEFFGMPNHDNYEDDFVRVTCHSESYGMTFVTLKKRKDFTSNVKDWSRVLERRRLIIETFLTKEDIRTLGVNLFDDFSAEEQVRRVFSH